MISVSEAWQCISAHVKKFKSQDAPLIDCYNKVLSDNILATREQPPFHRVAMDGIAFFWREDVEHEELLLEDIGRAGSPQKKLNNQSAAIEVMTGAVLPIGCNCVVKYEDLLVQDKSVKFRNNIEIKAWQNIHLQGGDYQAGELLLEAGQKINSAQMGIIASQGMKTAPVVKTPQIAIVSTGDELVEVGKEVLPHQIWKSNPYVLQTGLQVNGFLKNKLFHLPDNPEKIFNHLQKILEEHSIVIVSGGVSKGKFDYIPNMLADLGVEKKFHKVAQRPGKPIWFGVGAKEQLVFALPGNPVSATIGFHRYVIPALMQASGYKRPLSFAKLRESINFSKEMTLFKQVKVEIDKSGQLWATPLSNNGSGDFSSLAESDGFLELKANKSTFIAGESYPIYFWKEA